MQYDRLVVAYHGCDAAVAERVLGGEALKPSEEPFDWLGRGVYFWEFGLDRAWRWAREEEGTPGVVGAIIQLGACFDLLDTRATSLLAKFAAQYADGLKAAGSPLPRNKGLSRKARYLDCAIINWTLDRLEKSGGPRYQTVRCGFAEGGPVFRRRGIGATAIRRETHIQIAVRDQSCIVGVFRPTGQPP